MEEQFKSLKFLNYSKYEVSNLGRIRTVSTGYVTYGHLNKQSGYCQVKLRRDSQERRTTIDFTILKIYKLL